MDNVTSVHAAPRLRPFAALHGALAHCWSATGFASADLAAYATPHLVRQTRRGVVLLSLATLVFVLLSTLFAAAFDLGAIYIRTYLILAALALHVHVSARRVGDVRALHLLGMVLLIVCGSSLVLLARQSGRLHEVLLLNVAVLFMMVPLVPWGVREAALTSGAIYAMFTTLSFFSRSHFAALELWALQFLMVAGALVTLALVTRALELRKHDLTMRFHLEQAHRDMAALAHRDPLTGAWNRRHLEGDFARATAAHRQAGLASYFGLFDIDAFKLLNDTHGHACGDVVLQAIARAFGAPAGDADYLVRMGGDEFALLIAGDDVHARLAAMLRRLRSEIAAATPVALTPAVSIGLLDLSAAPALTLAQAYTQADALLYQAKRAGGDCVRCGVAALPDGAAAGIGGAGASP